MLRTVRRLKECPHTVSGRKTPYIPVSRCQCYSHWGWMDGWMNEWSHKWKDCCVHPISWFIIFCPCKHFLILFNFLFTLIHKLYLMLFCKWFLTPTFIKNIGLLFSFPAVCLSGFGIKTQLVWNRITHDQGSSIPAWFSIWKMQWRLSIQKTNGLHRTHGRKGGHIWASQWIQKRQLTNRNSLS